MVFKKIVGGGMVLAGLAGLLGCSDGSPVIEKDSSETKCTPTRCIVGEKDNKDPNRPVKVEELAENEYRVLVNRDPNDPTPYFSSIWGIYSRPGRDTGISAEIFVNADDKDPNAGITKLILYEDGQEIFSSDNDFAKVPVSHHEPGTHTYRAEAVDKGGNKAGSETIEIKFSGQLLDNPAWISSLLGFYIQPDGDLYIWICDEGDNKGIKKVRLYEDDNVVREFEGSGDRFEESIPIMSLNDEGKHTYFAEAIDNGGNVTRSETLTVTYVK